MIDGGADSKVFADSKLFEEVVRPLLEQGDAPIVVRLGVLRPDVHGPLEVGEYTNADRARRDSSRTLAQCARKTADR